MFGCERGGGGGSCIEIMKKNHLQLMFGYKGGGGGRSQVETTTVTTSSLHLDVREVVVVAT